MVMNIKSSPSFFFLHTLNFRYYPGKHYKFEPDAILYGVSWKKYAEEVEKILLLSDHVIVYYSVLLQQFNMVFGLPNLLNILHIVAL